MDCTKTKKKRTLRIVAGCSKCCWGLCVGELQPRRGLCDVADFSQTSDMVRQDAPWPGALPEMPAWTARSTLRIFGARGHLGHFCDRCFSTPHINAWRTVIIYPRHPRTPTETTRRRVSVTQMCSRQPISVTNTTNALRESSTD